MWKYAGLFLSLVVVIAEDKVPVSVYYESLCPDSIAFVTQQLVPTYNTDLKNYMDLKLVPYGKSTQRRSSDGSKWEFTCHHGPVECYGNKVQGCILENIENKDQQLKYIDCLMNQAKTIKNEYPINMCVGGGDLSIVTSCANSTQTGVSGSDILAKNGNETAKLSPPLTSVPTIVFNDVFNKSDHEMAQTNFKKVLCSYVKDECPSECSSATTLSISALVLVLSFLFLIPRF